MSFFRIIDKIMLLYNIRMRNFFEHMIFLLVNKIKIIKKLLLKIMILRQYIVIKFLQQKFNYLDIVFSLQ